MKSRKKMDRKHVDSSNLESIGYDTQSQTLEIEFQNGHIYQYFDVPEPVYLSLMAAGSHGKWFSENVKGYFRYARI
jgi:uncharacterized protein